MSLLAGKRALVIGAGSGIGAATARLFAQQGARVAVADIDAAGLAATVADLGAAPSFQLDITDAAAVRATVDAAAEALGGLDIALNTPFIAGHPDLLGLAPEQVTKFGGGSWMIRPTGDARLATRAVQITSRESQVASP